MIRTLMLAVLMLTAPSAAVAASGSYFAAPNGVDSGPCSQAQPCTPQGAFMRCRADAPAGDVCNIQLAPGDYIDPGINVFYYRFASFSGDCKDPSAVRLIGTIPGSTLAWVQDHAIGIFSCMQLVAHVGGVIGIAGRQHVIVDYGNIIFGNMEKHVSLNEFSIASCVGPVMIAGNAAVHADVNSMSKLNMLACPFTINGVFSIGYFINAGTWSVVAAQGATFRGDFFITGTQCNSFYAIVSPPQNHQPFPGTTPGNCQ